MANYLFVFTIVIVTASVSQSAQILKLLTNSKAFQPGVENDAKNDWGVDQDARGNQRQWILNKERTSQDVYRQKGKEGLQAVANVKEKLNTIKDLMQHGLPNKNKIKQESISVSLLQSQIQKPDQRLHIYNTNIFYPEVIERLENNTSSYYDTPKRKQQKSTDKSLQGNSLSNLLLYFYPTESVAKVFDTKRSSNTVRTSRKPSYYDDVDPGDGEGWFNYPITRPSVPNPAWHLSTLRRIYQQPRRIFKRSPKRRSKKRKRNKDERKKYNKKKRSRRKRRLMKGEKKKPKKKKGDGSYRGGRGRKPRMHKKRTNATLEHTKGGNDTEYYTEEESEGPVAGAYIDYDSSYEPPPKEEGEITDAEHKNNTNNAADSKDKTEKNAGSGDSKYETEEEGSGDSEYETDEEGSGDSEYETDEEGSGDSEYETDEEGSGDDETEEEEDGSGDEEYETEEESEENRSDEESTDDKSGDKKLKSEEDKNGNVEHKNGTKKACKNGICKEIKLDSKNVLESKIEITKVKEINDKKHPNQHSDVMKLHENEKNRKKLDIKDNLQHTIKNNEEDKKLRTNHREDILFKHELKPNTNEIINQLKLQQLQHLVKNPNNHASILLHPTDDDIVVLQEKERVKQFDHLLNEHQMNSVVNPENSKQNINLKNSNMNKITDTQIVENNVHKSKLQMAHVDAMTGTMSEISEILQSHHENVQKNNNIDSKRFKSKTNKEHSVINQHTLNVAAMDHQHLSHQNPADMNHKNPINIAGMDHQNSENMASINHQNPADMNHKNSINTAGMDHQHPENMASINHQNSADMNHKNSINTAGMDHQHPENMASINHQNPADTNHKHPINIAGMDHQHPENMASINHQNSADMNHKNPINIAGMEHQHHENMASINHQNPADMNHNNLINIAGMEHQHHENMASINHQNPADMNHNNFINIAGMEHQHHENMASINHQNPADMNHNNLINIAGMEHQRPENMASINHQNQANVMYHYTGSKIHNNMQPARTR